MLGGDDLSESQSHPSQYVDIEGGLDDGLSMASSQQQGNTDLNIFNTPYNKYPDESDDDMADVDSIEYLLGEKKDGSPTHSTSTSATAVTATTGVTAEAENRSPEKQVLFESLDIFNEDSSKEEESGKLSPVSEEDRDIAELQREVDLEEKKEIAKYDLGGNLTEYDLSGQDPDSSVARDDDQTSTTPHRSGASDFILHTWIKRKDWAAVQNFFNNPPFDEKKLYEAVHYANDDGETPLHIACRKRAPESIIRKLTKVGGRKAVLATNTYGNSTPLHHAAHFNASPEVIQHLINVGGVEAVRKADDIGNLALHWSLSKRLPMKNIKHLIELGGNETAKEANRIGWTALHTACYFDANPQMISFLINISGPEAVRKVDTKNRTPIDLILSRNPFARDSILVLLHSLGEIDQVSLYLPQETIDVILEWVRKQPDTAALECLCVQRILNETFISRKYLTVWMIDFYLQVILVGLFSFGIDNALREYGIRVGAGPAVGMYLCITWFLGREVIQFLTTPFNEFTRDLKNWIDVTQIIMVYMALDKLVFRGGVQSDADVNIVTVTAAIIWFNLLSVLGKAFYRIRMFIVYLQMVSRVISNQF